MQRLRRAAAGIGIAIGVVACSRSSGGGKVTGFRDALATGDAAKVTAVTDGAPTCMGPTGAPASQDCLSRAATWFGAKGGFHPNPPDDATAATAALLIARDGRGESIPPTEIWMRGLSTIVGPGADTLRLAISARMAASAPPLARALESDADARALMRAVAESVPGACDTYALLGAGSDDATLPPQSRAAHSACVQRDLERPSGPAQRGAYGDGVWRAAAGALAVWMDVGAALHVGIVKTDGATKAALEPRIVAIDAALAKIAPKQVPSRPDPSQFMKDGHDAPSGGKSDASP